MPYILAYTKQGEEFYSDVNYPGHIAKNCDVNDAMHLALSLDGKSFTPLRNNTGILFPKCTFSEGKPEGTTKTMLDPWVFRMADGSFGVSAVRRNQNAPDPLSVGCMMLFTSKNLVRYEEACFLKLSDEEVRHPRCRWDDSKGAYYLEWATEKGLFCGYTKYFKEVWEVTPCAASSFTTADTYDIPDIIPGNILEISKQEADTIDKHFGVIYHTGVAPMEMTLCAGKAPRIDELPKATCLYSDGSTHDKKVCWDKAALEAIDFSKPGCYDLPGEIYLKHYPFPMMDSNMSDPCVLHYNGKYYLTSSGGQEILMRVSDTLEGVFQTDPICIYKVPDVPGIQIGTWAAELHIIHGVPYILTALCMGHMVTVQSYILRCNGDPANPQDWEAPRLCVKPNGRPLTEGGISLDMTYFCVDGVHYVMWSDRKIPDPKSDPPVCEPADIYIATVDPAAPWQLTTEPQCILRPIYGWDRYETEVDEGPYLLRRGDDLFITISGSSTGMADLYCLGLLHAKRGNNLLTMEGWDWLPYPLLTKESVENEFGPGHNNFVKDPESGDDLMVYHAVPHDENGKTLFRKPGIRRVHWAATGYPYLEMTEERDLNPDLKNVVLKITVK